MTHIQELVAADPILGATRAQLESLQLERLRTTLHHAYANNAGYRKKFSAAGVHPDDLRSLSDLAQFPFTTKADLREAYPFGFFSVPMDQVARIHASSGTTGKPTVVGYTKNDLAAWSGLVARSIRAAGGRAGMKVHIAYGYGLVYRRLGSALRRGSGRLHGYTDVGRTDRKAGSIDLRFRAPDHNGDAQLYACHSR